MLTDPGVIPRKQNKMTTALELGLGNDTQPRPLSYFIHYTVIGNDEVTLSVCSTCHIVRPPRSFHCSLCNACIEVHDHHCPWVGTCVGKRNHKYFLWFVSLTSVLAMLVCGLNVIFMKKKLGRTKGSLQGVDTVVSLVLLIYSGIMLLSVLFMAVAHCYIALSGQTTNEDLRGKLRDGNPYNQGVTANCRSFCSSKKSRIFEQDYDPEALTHLESNVFVIKSKLPN